MQTVGGLLQRDVPKEAAERGEPLIARARMIVAIPFEVEEEPFEARRVEIVEAQRGGGAPHACVDERQQQAEGIAVGRDGVGTRVLVRDEPLGEGALEGCRKTRGAHRGPPGRRGLPSRVRACARSSGTASMCQ